MTGMSFEQEVRSVARALWHLPQGKGAAEFVGNDEIDCVCPTEDAVHLIECTVDRGLAKFREQATKLLLARSILQDQRGEAVKLWIVTREEPTPHQRSFAVSRGITALALDQFRRRLLNASEYLECRWSYRFGSAVDPESGSRSLPDDEYVELPMTETGSREPFNVGNLAALLQDGGSVLLLGPFGAGKSLTVREIFRELRRRFYYDGSNRVPVAINLREHWGQSEVDEILRRHAARVGFERGDQLVRAWNAGRLIVLLDGIDELAAPAFLTGPDAIRRSRQEALKVVRAFMNEARGKTGILLSGRDHYFDATREARQLLSLPADIKFIELGEFTEEQAHRYLKTKGIDTPLPQWLPRKPLLLGYLAARGLFNDVLSIEGTMGPAYAWNQFLERICEREAELATDIDKDSIRVLLETLATKTRESASGSGPLYEADLAAAYKTVTGYDPLESARVLLQRLPGLTARDQELGARSFVDQEMLQALRAGPVVRFIQNPYSAINVARWHHSLDEFGCSVAGILADRMGLTRANHSVAASEAVQRWREPTLAFDCLCSAFRSDDEGPLSCEGLSIHEGCADVLDLLERPLESLTLDNCLINVVRADTSSGVALRLRNCQIGRLEGFGGAGVLPGWFEGCYIDEYDNRQTNAAIMRSELVAPVKVLLTVIRKLFLQRGSGRIESALHRGIDPSVTKYVTPVLQALVSEGVIYSHPGNQGTIWHGNRNQRGRMLEILQSPTVSGDPLLKLAAELE